jgi:hypothetical protein
MLSLLKSILSGLRFLTRVVFPWSGQHNFGKDSVLEPGVCTPHNKSGLSVLPTCRYQTPSMKFAIFQVSEPGARANLICLEMPSLQSAAELEQWLRMNIGPRTDVTLLGRFDSVHFISSEAEVESLVFGGECLERQIQCLQR